VGKKKLLTDTYLQDPGLRALPPAGVPAEEA
jgi:hypothetical protein